jgi:hypothetical protein
VRLVECSAAERTKAHRHDVYATQGSVTRVECRVLRLCGVCDMAQPATNGELVSHRLQSLCDSALKGDLTAACARHDCVCHGVGVPQADSLGYSACFARA